MWYDLTYQELENIGEYQCKHVARFTEQCPVTEENLKYKTGGMVFVDCA